MTTPIRLPAVSVRFLVSGLLVLAFLEASAQAQVQPLISYVLPDGGQRGTTVQVGVRGRYLIGATGVYVSGGGVKGEVVAVQEPDKGKRVPQRLDAANFPHLARLAITIAPDAEVGERDLRIVSPGGVSNRFRFYVGDAPEISEPDESEKLLQEPIALESIPVVVNGQIFQADTDLYRFKATAGQTLVFEVDAQRIIPYIADGVPGWFQASLRLNDAQGNQLAYVDDFRHQPDPLLIYRFEKDGEYTIEVKDVLYRGRSDFVYRLSIGQRPYITHIFPLGGQRGSEVEVELHGANLPQRKMKVAIPADAPAMRWVGGVVNHGLTSNVVRFGADDLPETFETEPNDTPATATRIPTPVVVNGRIGSSTDVDHFVFAAKAKQTLKFEVFARRLDSPLDSLVTVLDSNGRALQSNDDTIDESAGHVTHHADSYLTYTFPAAGDYIVQIVDTQGCGGDEYAYRLVVAAPQPDYILRIRPDNPRTAQGSMTFLTVNAFRRDGFTGEISLSLKDLPPGYIAPDEAIPEKQNSARLTITAPLDAPIGLVRPKIVGTAADQRAKMDYEAAAKAVKEAEAAAAKAKADAEKSAAAQVLVERRKLAEAAKGKLGQVVVHEAEPCEEQMQAFYYMHNIPTKEFVLSVLERGPFALTLGLPPREVFKVPRSGRTELVVKASFKEGVQPGEITLKPTTIPREWQIEVPPIPPGQNQTAIKITVFGNMYVFPGQRGTLLVSATMKSGNQTVQGFVPAIPYEVVSQLPQ